MTRQQRLSLPPLIKLLYPILLMTSKPIYILAKITLTSFPTYFCSVIPNLENSCITKIINFFPSHLLSLLNYRKAESLLHPLQLRTCSISYRKYRAALAGLSLAFCLPHIGLPCGANKAEATDVVAFARIAVVLAGNLTVVVAVDPRATT